MLDSETKRRIDTARDILVGKVPDPKSQVEQITIALIYKFMDDMDAEAEELGGLRSFFVGEYEKFSWAKLLSPALGGYEMLSLYTEAVEKMTRNQGLPQLFRDIFKNAYLPYRDPETLKMFLKVINDFNYEHSEKLGDAFEYLLSVLGSQGDAGQFRTPRHIIDFMVDVVDPQKGDSILDPACGTAGFLISAYKHIMAANSPSPKSVGFGGGPGWGLKPEERSKLANNIRGYDISPDMVRLSLVNLYLHGFTTPNIFEYDTLTSDERWNEYADVILANPPFMSPKGGIKPHKRFSVQSNRSEVLFVDYMAEHLTPNGRAAIIVPEGIIFQSAGAYKQLRKYLIESNYLWAVVSLPAGVFNPYAGVKTSILFLDKSLAKRTDQILFVKIAADGFDLGAQRRPIEKNDLPQALNILHEWKNSVGAGFIPAWLVPAQPTAAQPAKKTLRDAAASPQTPVIARDGVLPARSNPPVQPVSANPQPPVIARDGVLPARSNPPSPAENLLDQGIASSQSALLAMTNALAVPILKLAETGDYNLSADRYREVIRVGKQTWPLVKLEEVATLFNGRAYKQEELLDDKSKTPVLRVGNLFTNNSWYYSDLELDENKYCSAGNLLYAWSASFGPFIWDGPRAIYHYHIWRVEHSDRIEKKFLYHMLKKVTETIKSETHGIAMLHMTKENMERIQIPLPPLEIQRQIVDEIAAHQRIIDGARQVVDGWRPDIEEKDIELVELGKCIDFLSGLTLSIPENQDDDGTPIISMNSVAEDGVITMDGIRKIKLPKSGKLNYLQKGDLLFNWRNGSKHLVGKTGYFEFDGRYVFASFLLGIRVKPEYIDSRYLWYLLNDYRKAGKYMNFMRQNVNGLFNRDELTIVKIPLPPLEIQRAIVARLERERQIVEGNRELIRLYEQKIKKVIERVWEG